MGKASFATKDMSDVGFGFERGKGRIVEATVRYHQYPVRKKDDPKTGAKAGDQSAPFQCVQLGLVHVDDALKQIDDEVKYVELGYMTRAQRDAESAPFSIGQAKNAADENPVDLAPNGVDLGPVGNCIYVKEDGVAINKKTAWGRFVESLEKKGFKSDVLGNGFIPDLIDTVADFGNMTLEKWEGYTGDKDPVAFVCQATPIVFPYEGKGNKGAAGKASTAKAPAAPAQPANTATAAAGAAPAGDLTAIAVNAAKLVVADQQGKELDLKGFRTKVQQKLMKMEVKPPTLHPKILELFKQDETVAAIGAEAGFMVGEDGGIVWPE